MEDWLCKSCVQPNGDRWCNASTEKTCTKCHISKGLTFGEKLRFPGRSPTTSARDEPAARPDLQKRFDNLQAQYNELRKQLSQCSPAPCNGSSEKPIVIEDDPEQAKVKALREQIKRVKGMEDNDTTTGILRSTRTQRLADLEAELQEALATQRNSKPLAAQHAQLEAYLGRLAKAHEGVTSKLSSAQEVLEQARVEVSLQLAAVAESQTRIDDAKKQAADIASRIAAELGAPPPQPAPPPFQPGSPEWGALDGIVRLMGCSEVHTALRTQGLPEEHLRTLTSCLDTVRSAGHEQFLRSTAATPPPTQTLEHISTGTAAVAAEAVADGNALQLAELQAKCATMESQLQLARAGVQELEADMSDTESTSGDGFKLKVKRRRKRLGEIGSAIAGSANP